MAKSKVKVTHCLHSLKLLWLTDCSKVLITTMKVPRLWCWSGLRSCVTSSSPASRHSPSFWYRNSTWAVDLYMPSPWWQRQPSSQAVHSTVFYQQVVVLVVFH